MKKPTTLFFIVFACLSLLHFNSLFANSVAPPDNDCDPDCPNTQSVYADINGEFIILDYLATGLVTANDPDCGSATFSQFPSPGTVLSPGEYEVNVYSFLNGDEEHCDFDLNIYSQSSAFCAPICPDNQIVSTNFAGQYTLPDFHELGIISLIGDDCSDLDRGQFPAANTVLTEGDYLMVIWVEKFDYKAQCHFNLTMQDDATPTTCSPVCPPDQTVTADLMDTFYTLPDYLETGSVQFDGSGCVTADIEQMPEAGTVLETGVTAIIFSANDNQCTFLLTVEELGNECFITCPDVEQVTTQVGEAYEIPDFFAENIVTIAGDGCPNATFSQSPEAGELVEAGTLEITATSGAEGNESSCTFQLEITEIGGDCEIICPADQMITLVSGTSYVIPDFVEEGLATLSGTECEGLIIGQNPSAGEVITGSGQISITGSISTTINNDFIDCQYHLTIQYVQEPIVCTPTCPESQTVFADADGFFQLPDYLNNGMVDFTGDGCGDATKMQSPNANAMIPVGDTEVTVQTQTSTNEANCNFMLMVEMFSNTSESSFAAPNIFPNPTQDWLMIDYDKNAIITVYSTIGKPLLTTDERRISVQNLPAGVYYLHIQTAEQDWMLRFLKTAN